MKIWYDEKSAPVDIDYEWIKSYEELLHRLPKMLIPIERYDTSEIYYDINQFKKYYDISEVVFCPRAFTNYIQALDYILLVCDTTIVYKTKNPFIKRKIKKHLNKYYSTKL